MKEVKKINVNILGEEYTINLNTPRELLTDCDGECARYDNRISMVDIDEIFDGNGTEKRRDTDTTSIPNSSRTNCTAAAAPPVPKISALRPVKSYPDKVARIPTTSVL